MGLLLLVVLVLLEALRTTLLLLLLVVVVVLSPGRLSARAGVVTTAAVSGVVLGWEFWRPRTRPFLIEFFHWPLLGNLPAAFL